MDIFNYFDILLDKRSLIASRIPKMIYKYIDDIMDKKNPYDYKVRSVLTYLPTQLGMKTCDSCGNDFPEEVFEYTINVCPVCWLKRNYFICPVCGKSAPFAFRLNRVENIFSHFGISVDDTSDPNNQEVINRMLPKFIKKVPALAPLKDHALALQAWDISRLIPDAIQVDKIILNWKILPKVLDVLTLRAFNLDNLVFTHAHNVCKDCTCNLLNLPKSNSPQIDLDIGDVKFSFGASERIYDINDVNQDRMIDKVEKVIVNYSPPIDVGAS